VKLNGSNVWYPVSMREKETGALDGVFPELAGRILEELGVSIEVGRQMPWNRLLTLLETGEFDMLAGAYLTNARLEKFGVSQAVMTEDVAVVVRKGLTTRPGSLEDLVGLRGVAPFGATFDEVFEGFAADRLSIDRQPFEDFSTNMRLLMDGKADYLVIARREGEMMVSELGAADLVEVLPWPATVNTLHFLFSRASPCITLLERFNQVLKGQLESGGVDRLIGEIESVSSR